MSDSDMRHIWRFLIETEQLGDGSWRAWSPTGAWSAIGATEQEAQDSAIDQAIERGENPDELARNAPRGLITFEADDPRVGWVWRFHPQTEQFSDGSWRAWFASGGWTVTGSTEKDAVDKANLEWFRRREHPDEVARRIAMMRRHLSAPVPGVENFDSSVLDSAWTSDNPGQAVRSIIAGLGD
ncbi:hypothetical protein [Mycobacterium sp.]|uniref:hypothetical protein n=1 Tax=Mycobacterium sp. TaxID=1785 RepID=UPI003C743299